MHVLYVFMAKERPFLQIVFEMFWKDTHLSVKSHSWSYLKSWGEKNLESSERGLDNQESPQSCGEKGPGKSRDQELSSGAGWNRKHG